jgi:hypothetical protein
VKSASPQSVLLTMFIDAKMDELLNIYSKAPQTDKNQAFETLQGIYPSYTNKLNEIKKAAAK